jgi:hypothetical protein
MHIFLRVCLALTPSDAVVQSAFSRLRMILADRRPRLSSDVVEQLLIFAFDSTPWDEYNFDSVLEAQQFSARRVRFRLKRADKGTKRRPKRISKGKGRPNVDEGSIPMLIPCHTTQCTESSELNTCFALDKFNSSAAGAKAKHHDAEDVLRSG